MSLLDDLRSILGAGRGVRVPPTIGGSTVSRGDRTWLVGVPFIWLVDPRYRPTFQKSSRSCSSSEARRGSAGHYFPASVSRGKKAHGMAGKRLPMAGCTHDSRVASLREHIFLLSSTGHDITHLLTR
jgi:hypothetical protein